MSSGLWATNYPLQLGLELEDRPMRQLLLVCQCSPAHVTTAVPTLIQALKGGRMGGKRPLLPVPSAVGQRTVITFLKALEHMSGSPPVVAVSASSKGFRGFQATSSLASN